MSKNLYPLSQISIELTNACNFECIYCPDDIMARKQGVMDKDLAIKLLNEISDYNLSRSVAFFLMGEPLLHPHFETIVQHAVQRRLNVIINTNGSRFQKGRGEKLLSTHAQNIIIGMQLVGEKTFGFRNKNFPSYTYQNYESDIKEFIRNKFKLQSKSHIFITIMTTPNRNEVRVRGDHLTLDHKDIEVFLAPWKQFKEELQKEFQFDSKENPTPQNDLKKWLNLNWFYELAPNVRIEFCRAHDWYGQLPRDHSPRYLTKFGSCNALSDQFAVLWNGDYTTCCVDYDGKLKFSNASKLTIREALESKIANRIRKEFRQFKLTHPLCQTCRGGYTRTSKLKNQIKSFSYNLPIYTSVRKFLSTRV